MTRYTLKFGDWWVCASKDCPDHPSHLKRHGWTVNQWSRAWDRRRDARTQEPVVPGQPDPSEDREDEGMSKGKLIHSERWREYKRTYYDTESGGRAGICWYASLRDDEDVDSCMVIDATLKQAQAHARQWLKRRGLVVDDGMGKIAVSGSFT